MAGALDAAHTRGLVHRDVKPSNVLVAADEHVYLADFGLSRSLGEAGSSLGATQSLGTIDYVAPEQIRGEDVDGRADVYALGCLLQECLTGEPPFRRSTDAAVLFAHLEEKPAGLPGLEQVMTKALAKEPDGRFETCHQLVEATRSALGLETKPSRWPFAVAAVGVALIGAALLAFLLSQGDGSAKAEPGADSLVRIDPKTNRVTETMPVGRKASGVAAAGRFVWVTNAGDGTIWRIDPKTAEVLKVAARGTPTGIAVGSSALVADGPEHRLVTINPASGSVRYETALPGSAGPSLQVATGEAGAWFARPRRADRRQGRGGVQGRHSERAGPHTARPDQLRLQLRSLRRTRRRRRVRVGGGRRARPDRLAGRSRRRERRRQDPAVLRPREASQPVKEPSGSPRFSTTPSCASTQRRTASRRRFTSAAASMQSPLARAPSG